MPLLRTIHDALKTWADRSPLGDCVLGPLAAARERRAWRRMGSPRERICRQYEAVFGTPPNLDNPRTLNEKIQASKLRGASPLQTAAADKLAVRDLVARACGPELLVPLLGSWERPQDVYFDALPQSFILKDTHTSGDVLVVRDKSALDLTRTRILMSQWLRRDYYLQSLEPQYRDIPRRLMAETLLAEPDGSLPMDYKFHCFGGKPAAVQVDLDRETCHRRNFYSPDAAWRLLPFVWSERLPDGAPAWPNGTPVPRPDALDQMLDIASRLAAPWPYVRVDLYWVGGHIYFGELTFHHGGGFEPFWPPSRDAHLATRWP